MVVKKMMEAWELSNDDKKVIKENAQKIKDFFTLIKADTCLDLYNWCKCYDHDFLGYIENFLPFVKEGRKYISEDNIKDLVHEIDSAIKNIKPFITKDDFNDEDDVICFIINKYVNNIELVRKIIEVCDEESINKLLND